MVALARLHEVAVAHVAAAVDDPKVAEPVVGRVTVDVVGLEADGDVDARGDQDGSVYPDACALAAINGQPEAKIPVLVAPRLALSPYAPAAQREDSSRLRVDLQRLPVEVVPYERVCGGENA